MTGAFRLRRLATSYGLTREQSREKKVWLYINSSASEFQLLEPAKNDIKLYYDMLLKQHSFTNRMLMEERIAAICYIVILEHNYGYRLKEIAKRLDIPSKRLNNLARLYAKIIGKYQIFQNYNISGLLEKHCLKLDRDRKFINDCLALFDYINTIEPQHPSNSYLSGLIYFVETTQIEKQITQKKISEVIGTGTTPLKNNYKKIKTLLSVESTLDLTIDDIINGIR